MSDSVFPPRKRDWKKGKWQIGLFLRSPDGATVEMVNDNPGKKQVKAALAALNAPDDK